MKTISPSKLLEAHWLWEKPNKYQVTSTISADKKFNFINLLEIFDKFNIPVLNFSIKNNDDSDKKIIKIAREVSNPWQIWMLCEYLKKYKKMLKTIKRSIK
jgi:hypothetical protein